ncbi:uncharacterized protein ARMOST_02155 [Armillaria ostoyae]|uniref:SHSP domain-containing protein n=1 Tax=Armillaria ostoyae TaxID=47428 RepID=A0A284QR47_ARMOS|nr:uncharacterized protein ARMOST_02155 [Armillaria ostoyae]
MTIPDIRVQAKNRPARRFGQRPHLSCRASRKKTLHDGRLTISGEVKTSTVHKEEGYAVRSASTACFKDVEGVKEEQVKVSFENGVLT